MWDWAGKWLDLGWIFLIFNLGLHTWLLTQSNSLMVRERAVPEQIGSCSTAMHYIFVRNLFLQPKSYKGLACMNELPTKVLL